MTTNILRKALAATIAALMLAAIAGTIPAAATTTTTYLYVKPDGNDAADGTRPGWALATLTGAEQRLNAIKPTGPVEIRMYAGVYTRTWVQRFGWSNGQPVTIRGYGGPAILDGRGVETNYGLRISPRVPGTDMRLTLSNVHVQNASNGIQIRDARNVRVNYFRATRIGDLYSPAKVGYAALAVINSQQVTIDRPTFDKIENGVPTASYVHAIYAMNGSTDLRVNGGTYRDISGDPIRVRNGSHRLIVTGGVFQRAGKYAVLSDWRNPATGETRSLGVVLRKPTIDTGWRGAPWRVGVVACFDGGAKVAPTCPIRYER